MTFKFTILRIFILVLAGHCNPGMDSAIGSHARESVEPEDSKSQKIQHKINKKYGALWDEEKKQRIHNQTLQFFNNCSGLWKGAIAYPLKVFSTCSTEEAQDLITMTQSLSKTAQDEENLHQAYLLRDIAAINPDHRPVFTKQLERFTQRELYGDFSDISVALLKCKPDHYVYITDVVLQFFNNCPKLWTGAVAEPFKIFSSCSPEEAQDLIKMTQSLSKTAQDEENLHQARLLDHIAKTESVKRTAAYLPLLKIAQHFEERSTYLVDGFYELYEKFVKLDPSQYEWMADQVIRFGASERNVNKLDIDKGKKIIQSFKDMPSQTQPLFSVFVEVNQVINFELAQQLVQVPCQDWVATLQGLRNQRGLGHQLIIEFNNQTAHDKQVEQDISTALTKLKKRYGEKPLENVVSLFKGKMKGALDQHLLSDQEHQIALLCLNKIGSKMLQDLSLIYQALEEKSLNLSAQELCERWASWTKSALIDSQLAYWKDRGMKGIPPQDQWSQFESCLGGSANRLIFALNLLHEDVVIKEGQEVLENMEKYKQERAYARLSIYGQEQLSQDLTAYQKDHPQASKEEIKAYLQGQFQKTLGEDNQSYLEMPKFQELIKAFLETLDLS